MSNYEATIHYTGKDSRVAYLKKQGLALLSGQEFQTEEIVNFLAGYGPDKSYTDYALDDLIESSTQLVKFAGQTCYMSFGEKRTKNKDAEKYIRNLLAQGHFSVLEHASFSFLIYGVSRSLSHELVRHRHFSFSQVSQRYVSGDNLRFVERPEFQESLALHQAFLTRIEQTVNTYEELQARLKEEHTEWNRKEINGAARACLTNEVEAPLVITGNARIWRHFLRLRGSIYAEAEIRALACLVLRYLKETSPLLFLGLEIEARDSIETIKSEYEG